MAGEPTVVLIPARLRSTRLPDKPLAEIGGVPMMVRTTPLLSFKPAFPRCGGILMTSAVDSGRYFRSIEPVERAWDGGRDG